MANTFDGHATEKRARPVHGDFTLLLQYADDMMGMVNINIFNTKIPLMRILFLTISVVTGHE